MTILPRALLWTPRQQTPESSLRNCEMAFRRLIRFIGVDGNAHFGDVDDAPAAIGEEAELLDGDLDVGLKRTGRREKIEKVR